MSNDSMNTKIQEKEQKRQAKEAEKEQKRQAKEAEWLAKEAEKEYWRRYDREAGMRALAKEAEKEQKRLAKEQAKSKKVHGLNWNGGLSHVIQITKEKVDIYHCLDMLEDTDAVEAWWTKDVLEFPSFMEGVEPTMVLTDVTKSEVFEGAALFHLSDDRFVFVEKDVREFRLLPCDSFVRFVTVVGNASVPQSYIVGTNYTYILSCKSAGLLHNYLAFPNELFGEVYEKFFDDLSEDDIDGIAFFFKKINAE